MTVIAFNVANGNWNVIGNWLPAQIPVQGDTITIATAQTCTVPAGYVANIGTSPDDITTMAITLSGATPKLIVEGTLNIYGNYTDPGAALAPNFVVNASASKEGTVVLHSDVRPTTKVYVMIFGSGNRNSYAQLTGTSYANMAKIGTTDNTCRWQQTGFSTIIADYGQLNNCCGGAATTAGWAATFFGNAGYMRHCTMDGTNFLAMNGNSAGQTFEMTDVTMTNCNRFGFQGYCGFLGITNANCVATLTRCYSDGTAPNAIGTMDSFRVSECIAVKSDGLGGGTGVNTTCQYFLSIDDSTAVGPLFSSTAGNVKDNFYISNKGSINPHWSGPQGPTVTEVVGMLYQATFSADDGDCNNGFPSGRTGTWPIKHCLAVPNLSDYSPGAIFEPLSQISTDTDIMEVTNNGWIVSNTGFVHSGETNTGHTGQFSLIKNNYVRKGATNPGGAGKIVYNNENTTIANKMVAAGAHHNFTECGASYATLAQNYDLTNQTSPAATGDAYNIAGAQIDNTRNIEKWAQWWGTRVGASGNSTTTPGTAATMVNARLLLANSYNGTYTEGATTVQYMLRWIRRGHIPRLLSMRQAGDNSLTPTFYGAWAPTLSALSSANRTTGSVTTNIADGTIYGVITSSATVPDWDRIKLGKDATGATATAAFTAAVTGSGAQALTWADPGAGTYYVHVIHEAVDAGVADVALKTSAELGGVQLAGAIVVTGSINMLATSAIVAKERPRSALTMGA